MTADVICTWSIDKDGVFVPSVSLAGYAIQSVTDVTGQDGASIVAGLDPNALIVRVVAPESVIDEIDADPDFLIVWSE